MPNFRLFLVIALFTLGFMLYQQWQIDYGPDPVVVENTDAPLDTPTYGVDTPDAALPTPQSQDAPAPVQTAQVTAQADLIEVTTDVLALTISTQGGDIIDAELLDYPVELKSPDVKVQLFNHTANEFYVAQSGLVSATHQTADHREVFTADQLSYQMGEADELVVPLRWQGSDGITITKIYRFQRGSYEIGVSQEISNNSDKTWQGSQYRQFQRVQPPEQESNAFSDPSRFSFLGAAMYSSEEKYEKFDFDDIGDESIQRSAENGWVGMVQHYFLSAWIPTEGEINTLTAEELNTTPKRYLVRAVAQPAQVEAGQTQSLDTKLWVGPKLQDELSELAEGLKLTVDYGFFTPFSLILFWILKNIHALVGNWGWSIILLTILVKAIFYKLTETQYRSMAKLRKLTPRIQALKERYGDDKQKFNIKMMEIYKEEKANPLGGCLPMLVQIPVFLALYWVLVESVEMRQAPFMLWLQDLSSPDPYFILPIINGIAMFMTTKLSPQPAADPIQQKIFLAMPIVFSVMFAFFQSGLVLYWAVNAMLSLAQQWYILRKLEATG